MAISEKLTKINEEVVTQEGLLEQIQTALAGKVSGASPEIETQEKEVIPTTEIQEVVPDEGKLLSKVIVAAIPTETWVFTLEDGSTVTKEVGVG